MSNTTGADSDELAAEFARLEKALERIDYLASGNGPGAIESDVKSRQISPVILDRLDSMIARLRAAIDEA